MFNQKNLSNKRLSLTSIGLLIVSIFLIFGARIIVSQLSLMAVLSTPELFAYVPAFCVAGYVLMAAGVAGFLYVGLRSRFQVDTQRIKTQSRKLKFSIVALTCLMMCTSFLMTAPIVSANTVATTGYYLATPLPIADWYLGNYSTGNIFAINGSSWANLMTYPAAAPWASVTGNYTAVWENVLAATSYGTIYAKEVAFPLSLHTTIPNNTQVICNYQGVTYTFTNSTNSMGSPYTVETGAVKYDTTMYTAKDSGNRILWSSTIAETTINNALHAKANNTVTLTDGDYWVGSTASVTFTQPFTTLQGGRGAVLHLADAADRSMITIDAAASYSTIKGITLDGNSDGQTASELANVFWYAEHFSMLDTYSYDCYGDAATGEGKYFTAIGNIVENCLEDSFHPTDYSIISGNTIIGGHSCIKLYVPTGYVAGHAVWTNNMLVNLTGCSGFEIFGDGEFVDITIANNMVVNPEFCGVQIGYKYSADRTGLAHGITIENNQFINSGHHGVHLTAYGLNYYDVSIKNNKIMNSSQASTGTYSGILIEPRQETNDISIVGNDIVSYTTTVRQRFGIRINTSTSDSLINRLRIEGNNIVNVSNAQMTFTVNTASTPVWINGNFGYITENIVSMTNSTATTFALETGLYGNVTFASYMFDATTQAISDFKIVSGVQTSTTVWTVTVSGTNLPATMTCKAYLTYNPLG